MSTVPLQLRYFFINSPAANYAFAGSYLYCRILEQLPFVTEFGRRVYTQATTCSNGLDGTATTCWSVGTKLVVVAWGLLTLLNLVWSSYVIRAVVRKVRGASQGARAKSVQADHAE